MNDRVLSRIKQKRSAFQLFCTTRDGQDYLNYAKARNSAKAEARKAVREYEHEIAKQSKRNPKSFFRYVNSKLKTRSGLTDLKSDDGGIISEDDKKASAFNSFFSSVLQGMTRKTSQNLILPRVPHYATLI